MTLDEFEQKAKKDLDYFFAVWRENAAADPEDWPSEMSEADWFEQLQVHYSVE